MLRLAPGAVEWLTVEAGRLGCSRSALIRELLAVGMRSYGRGVRREDPQGDIGAADWLELRRWREFADRTAINGDPERRVTPDIDMHGWTFLVMPQRDENLEIA